MKKIFGLILTLFTLMLVSCVGVDEHDAIYEELVISYIGDDNKDSVTYNIGLKVESKLYPEAKINWSSSNDSVLKINNTIGVVTRSEVDIVVTLTLHVDYNDKVKEYEYEITVIGLSSENNDVASVVNGLVIPLETKSDINLLTEKDGVNLTWTSNKEEVISNTGQVTRQEEDVTVKLTVVGTKDDESANKTFDVKVLGLNSQGGEVNFEEIFSLINLPETATSNLVLPNELMGAFLSWESSNKTVITNEGLVTRELEDVLVTLTVTATKGSEEASKIFTVKVLKTVLAPESTKMPIVDVREMSVGSNVEIHGVATSIMSNGNYTLQDSTGAIPVYFGSGKNSELKVGNEYIISGKVGEFQGLVQITNPVVTTIGPTNLPDVLDISQYSLDFEDVTLYEGYVVNYSNLEVTEISSPSNAHELYVKNANGETGMTRLDLRVNNNVNHFKDIKVGEIINLENVTVGQYNGKAQFMFTSRSIITARPKDPNMPQINGGQNITYVIGVDSEPNYLEGITANNANGVDFTNNLQVDSSKVNLNTPGIYEVKISVVGVTNYPNISITITIRVRNEAKPGDYEGYYESLQGLTGDAFNNELERLIRNTGSATGSTNQVKQVDNFNGRNYNIYTGYGGYGNREHVWPNSKLGNAPKYDLHNLRAAVVSVNSSRGNKPFAYGSGSYGSVGSGWYPGDEHVGDVARIVLYISVRYRLNLNLVGNLQMFLRWHEEDPVSEFELSRNDKIESIQRNRNPFIDHPELVEIYFG